MHAVELIAQAIAADDPDRPQVDGDTRPGVCCLTGAQADTVPRKDVLGPSFTEGALLAFPASDRIGVSAAIALKYKWERMSSWICDGRTFLRLDRIGVRNAVLSAPPDQPWCAYATTSYKKHGALRAPVNTHNRRLWVFENASVDLDAVDALWPRLLHARTNGVPRPVLETLDAGSTVMRAYGVREWLDLEDWARPNLRTAAYAFACYLLPSEDELKNERKQNRQDPVPTVQPEKKLYDETGQADLFS